MLGLAVLFGALPAAAGTTSSIDDASGDERDLSDGSPTSAPAQDIVRVDVDVTDGIDVVVEFAAPRSVEFLSPIFAVSSPWGGGAGGFAVLRDDFSDPDAPPRVLTIDEDGLSEQCSGATVSGDGTATLSVSVPATCVNPPDMGFVDVVALDSTTGDVLDERVLLDTYGTGAHSITGLIDGDPATTDRLDAAGPVAAAVAASRGVFPDGAGGAVLASRDVFADALAGSSLLATAAGPLLFTHADRLPQQTADELTRLLPAGSTVHVLGGRAAVTEGVVDQVRALGLEPRRVAGENRITTSIAVADELADVREVLLVRSHGSSLEPNGTAAWADSIAVAPYAAIHGDRAVVLVHDALWSEHRDLLARLRPDQVTILGGDAAVPARVASEVEALGYPVRRVAGANRFATTARVEEELFSAPAPLAPARPLTGPRGVAVLNGRDPLGWAFGLAAALPAAAEGMPFAMVTDLVVADEAVPSLESCAGEAEVEVLLLGGTGQIPTDIADDIDALDPKASCG